MSSNLYRKNLISHDAMAGLDSTQGYLELGTWYKDAGVNFICDVEDQSKFGSMYHELCKLQAEGYLDVEWVPYPNDDGRNALQLNQVHLTTSGRCLLDDLQSKSKAGRIKKRLGELFWVVATSMATTLVVLWLRGE